MPTDTPDARNDLEIIYRNPVELLAYEMNTRTHSVEQVEKVRASIRQFGFANPILLKGMEKQSGQAIVAISLRWPKGWIVYQRSRWPTSRKHNGARIASRIIVWPLMEAGMRKSSAPN